MKIKKVFLILVIVLIGCEYVELPDFEEEVIKIIEYLNCIKDGENGVKGLDQVIRIAISPDNKNVYTVGYSDSTLVGFNRDSTTGDLQYSMYYKDGTDDINGISGAYDIAVSPDNKNVYVAGNFIDSLAVFKRDINTGELTYTTHYIDNIGNIDGLDGITSVAVSPDNKNVYVTGFYDNSLAVFDRNIDTGELTFSICFKDGIDNVNGLDSAYHVTVSPDNKSVYVAGIGENALAVFNRNVMTGELQYLTYYKDGENGVNGLYEIRRIFVSYDNKNVYTVGSYEDTLTVFKRDVNTGELIYSSFFVDNVDGTEGLDHAYSVAVSPDNENVYVTGFKDNALAVFDRNINTGDLKFVKFFRDGMSGVDGIKGAASLTVSPDSRNIYVTGYEGKAIAVFSCYYE